MELWGITDSGKVRRDNQDVFKILFDEEKDIAVFVVCDGMGGANAGNIASSLAAEVFMHHMGKYIENAGEISEMAQEMSKAVLNANSSVYEKSLSEAEYAGMGTTLAAAISTAEGQVVVNIGDSRVYHVTKKKIKQITRDHSVIEDMIARGDLSRAQARKHPNKHLITRALGTTGDENPDVFFVKLNKGEHLLLCTDGLSNVVMESEMLYELQRGANVKECCEKLIKMTLDRGAPDNVTVVIFKN